MDNNNKTGRGTKTWPYFQQFNRLFGKDPKVQPVAIVGNREVKKQYRHVDPLVVEEVTDVSKRIRYNNKKNQLNEIII